MMKQNFILFCLMSCFMLSTQVNSFASCEFDVLAVSLNGPEGRCAAPAGTWVTYTANHSPGSNGCTIYEWTIDGGNLVGPNGGAVTNGTLCITESFSCDAFCGVDGNLSDPSIPSTVTVAWYPGVQGSLKLKVKEKSKDFACTLVGSAEIKVDLRVPDITALNENINSNGSTTFTAELSDDLCSDMDVRWTKDGEDMGTGNPRTFDVGPCSAGEICAVVRRTGGLFPLPVVESNKVCRTFLGGDYLGNMEGPNEVFPFSTHDYSLSFNTSVFESTNWSISSFPPTGAAITSGTTGNSVTVTFGVSGLVNLSMVGVQRCGGVVTLNKEVQVAGNPNIVSDTQGSIVSTIRQILDPVVNTGQSTNAFQQTTSSSNTALDFEILPSLAKPGQEVILQLPILEKETQIWVSNINGQSMLQLQTDGGQIILPTHDLPAGVYFITARTANMLGTKRLVIQ